MQWVENIFSRMLSLFQCPRGPLRPHLITDKSRSLGGAMSHIMGTCLVAHSSENASLSVLARLQTPAEKRY